MICIRVPMELLTQTKSIDFDINLEVIRREIEDVEMLNSQTGENLGKASFQSGLTELQMLRRSGSPVVKSRYLGEERNCSAAYESNRNQAVVIQKIKPAMEIASAPQTKKWN